MEVKLKPGVQRLKGKVNREAVEIYPELEDLVVEPSLEERKFKSEKYGYNEVTVKAIESEELNITPSVEEQVLEGLFDKVTVAGDSNLVAENIKQGTSIFGVEGTLGNEPVEKYIVRAIDYDGTVLKEEELAEGDEFELPEIPEHEGLISQGWSSPVDIVDNTVIAEDQDITIGLMYETVSGASEFDIELNKLTGLTVELNSVYYNITIDWGDGETVLVSTSNQIKTHTYSEYGKYTIKFYGFKTIPYNIFGCNNGKINNFIVKNIRIGNSVTKFADNAFSYFESLESITLPMSITNVGNYMFNNNKSLKAVVFPINIQFETSKVGLFSECTNLEYVVLPKGITITPSFSYDYQLKNVTIPKTVTTISSFSRCYSINKIKIHEGVTEIKDFTDTPISNIIIPKTLTTIGNYTFEGTKIEEIIIPDNVQSMGIRALGSNYLKKVLLPNNLTLIEQGLFSGCYTLRNIDIPDSVITINSSAFMNCFSLEKIIIPPNITSIKASTFYQCKSLNKIDFSKVKSIPTLDSTNAFAYIYNGFKIIVPDELYDEWIVATNWVNYANNIYKASEVVE